MTKVLIVGGEGYIGSELKKVLSVREDIEYDIYDILVDPKQDIRNPDIKYILPDYDVIIHLAAVVGEPACKMDTSFSYDVNVNGAYNIISRLSKDQRIIFLSTSSVYGEKSQDTLTEKDLIYPVSNYARQKALVENMITHNLGNYVIFRPVTAFGISTLETFRLDLLVHTLIYTALTKKHIDVYEPDIMRQCIYVKDLANVINLAIEDLPCGIYNVGSDKLKLTKLALAKHIAKVTDATINIVENTSPELRDLHLSFDKIQQRYHFNQGVSLLESLACQIKQNLKYISQHEQELYTTERVKKYLEMTKNVFNSANV